MSSGRQRTQGSEFGPLGHLRDRRGSHLATDSVLRNDRSFLYLRTEEPRQRANGTFPVKNDYFFTLGVSLTLG
jgi:hypothetical protein